MSVLVSGLVWKHANVKGGTFTVLLAMADIADDDGERIYPSERFLAEKCRMSERQVRRCVAELESMKPPFIKCVERASGRLGHYDRYEIDVDAVIKSNPEGFYAESKRRKAARNHRTKRPVDKSQTTGHLRQNHRTSGAQPPDISGSAIDNRTRSTLDTSLARSAPAPALRGVARSVMDALQKGLRPRSFEKLKAYQFDIRETGTGLRFHFVKRLHHDHVAGMATEIEKALGQPVEFYWGETWA